MFSVVMLFIIVTLLKVYFSLQFQVYDYDSSGSHSLIGECEIELAQLKNADTLPVLDLINQKKKAKKKDYRNSGKLTVMQCTVTRE